MTCAGCGWRIQPQRLDATGSSLVRRRSRGLRALACFVYSIFASAAEPESSPLMHARPRTTMCHGTLATSRASCRGSRLGWWAGYRGTAEVRGSTPLRSTADLQRIRAPKALAAAPKSRIRSLAAIRNQNGCRRMCFAGPCCCHFGRQGTVASAQVATAENDRTAFEAAEPRKRAADVTAM